MVKNIQLGARVLLGLIYFVFGLMGLAMTLGLMKMPEPAMPFTNEIASSGYFMPVLKVTEALGGLCLLTGIVEQGGKMVFANADCVLHYHPTRWRDYWNMKFYHGLWRMRNYQLFPRKLLALSSVHRGFVVATILVFVTAIMSGLKPDAQHRSTCRLIPGAMVYSHDICSCLRPGLCHAVVCIDTA